MGRCPIPLIPVSPFVRGLFLDHRDGEREREAGKLPYPLKGIDAYPDHRDGAAVSIAGH